MGVSCGGQGGPSQDAGILLYLNGGDGEVTVHMARIHQAPPLKWVNFTVLTKIKFNIEMNLI